MRQAANWCHSIIIIHVYANALLQSSNVFIKVYHVHMEPYHRRNVFLRVMGNILTFKYSDNKVLIYLNQLAHMLIATSRNDSHLYRHVTGYENWLYPGFKHPVVPGHQQEQY